MVEAVSGEAWLDSDFYTYRATVLRWVDADTVFVSVDLGFNIFVRQMLRLAKIDAYERNTIRGQQAVAWVRAVAPVGTGVVVETFKDKQEKYGRFLATVWHEPGEVSLNQQLIDREYAVVAPW